MAEEVRLVELDPLVEQILAHPSFRESVSRLSASPMPQRTTRISYNTPQEKLSSLYRRRAASSDRETYHHHHHHAVDENTTTTSVTTTQGAVGEVMGSISTHNLGNVNSPSRFRRGHTFYPKSTKKNTKPYQKKSSAAGSGGRSRNSAKFITKKVVLLPDNNETKIIRGERKALLMEQGFIRSELELDKSWDEREVHEFLKSSFKAKLDLLDDPYCCKNVLWSCNKPSCSLSLALLTV